MHDLAPRWAILHKRVNKLDGTVEHFEWSGLNPVLFWTRAQARQHIKFKYGYIRNRPDLRREPHGWKVPRPVKVQLHLTEVK